jgi:hypothetical protein
MPSAGDRKWRTGRAIERLSHAGAVPNTSLAVLTELFRDWASPGGRQAREVIDWYFTEVPKVTDEVGVDPVAVG